VFKATRPVGFNIAHWNLGFVSDFELREVIAKLQNCREKAQKGQENCVSVFCAFSAS
jgi:hypothetical protein